MWFLKQRQNTDVKTSFMFIYLYTHNMQLPSIELEPFRSLMDCQCLPFGDFKDIILEWNLTFSFTLQCHFCYYAVSLKVGQHMQKRCKYRVQCACDQCVMEKLTVHAYSVQVYDHEVHDFSLKLEL